MARKEDIVRQTGAAGAAEKLERQGIAVFPGQASFQGEHSVSVAGQVLRGERILIATGSQPARADIPGLDEVKPITSLEAVSLPKLPTNMIIIGGGPVGCEFLACSRRSASRWCSCTGRRCCRARSPELSRVVQDALEANGVTLVAQAKVNHFHMEGALKKASAEVRGTMHDLVAEEILLATGREARTAGLGLPAAGVVTKNAGAGPDQRLPADEPTSHLHAAGDVCGPPFQYTHFAHYQGRLAAANMFADTPV